MVSSAVEQEISFDSIVAMQFREFELFLGPPTTDLEGCWLLSRCPNSSTDQPSRGWRESALGSRRNSGPDAKEAVVESCKTVTALTNPGVINALFDAAKPPCAPSSD